MARVPQRTVLKTAMAAMALVMLVAVSGCSKDTTQGTPATAAPGPTAAPALDSWHPVASSLVAFSTESTPAVFDTLRLADPVEFVAEGQSPQSVPSAALSEPSAWTVETATGPRNVLELLGGGAVESGTGAPPTCDGDLAAIDAPTETGESPDAAVHAWIVPADPVSCDGWYSVTLDLLDGVISRVTLVTPTAQ